MVTEECAQNCTGHGVCNQGKCTCFPGLWKGDACDQEIYLCPSALSDCNGHGDCLPSDPQNAESSWNCTCDSGYCGDACELVCGGCPSNCSGHGMCTLGTCICDEGFTGESCSSTAPIFSCPANCSGHGLCSLVGGAFQCVCQDCYTGPGCSDSGVFCPGNCSGRGMCGCDAVCTCQTGYSGEACQQVEATCEEFHYCSGNGECVDNSCRCNPGFAGLTCNIACHTGGVGTVGCNADRNHGRCGVVNATNEPVCLCMPEYTGVGCEQNTTSSMLEEYVNGWNPLGTVVIILAVVCVVAFVAGLVVNYFHGKRGINAVPGISSIRSKVKGADYEGQRNESNY